MCDDIFNSRGRLINLNEKMPYLYIENFMYKTVVKLLIGPWEHIQVNAFVGLLSMNVMV
jgi:hypothetical protein